MGDRVRFPVVRSGVLFGELGPADRRMYFDQLSNLDPLDADPRAFYGTNGWARMSADNPEASYEGFLGQYVSLTPEQRRDLAYGNALDRYLSAAYAQRTAASVEKDAVDGIDGLSGGRPDAIRDASDGQFDPDSATSALFKSTFGGV